MYACMHVSMVMFMNLCMDVLFINATVVDSLLVCGLLEIDCLKLIMVNNFKWNVVFRFMLRFVFLFGMEISVLI